MIDNGLYRMIPLNQWEAFRPISFSLDPDWGDVIYTIKPQVSEDSINMAPNI